MCYYLHICWFYLNKLSRVESVYMANYVNWIGFERAPSLLIKIKEDPPKNIPQKISPKNRSPKRHLPKKSAEFRSHFPQPLCHNWNEICRLVYFPFNVRIFFIKEYVNKKTCLVSVPFFCGIASK